MEEIDDYGLKSLCAAIVERSILDYIKALADGNEAQIGVHERFYRSTWFAMLSDINPNWLIRHCKEKVGVLK
jgi:hypothetical protein